MRHSKSALLAISLAAVTTPAAAQWLYQGEESAFGDDGLNVAVTGKGLYGFAFRCKGTMAEALYLTPDTSMQESYEDANKAYPKLKLRVDKGEILDLDAKLSDSDGKLAAVATVDLDILKAAQNAKSGLSVALSLLGQNFHENKFSARGSGKAIKQLIAGCKLDEPEEEEKPDSD